MSLFKLRNWWKTQCPTVEPSYDSFSLHCSRLCLEEGEKDSIVIGCHSGQLCIYQPSGERASDLDLEDDQQHPRQEASKEMGPFENAFQHADVILETMLPLPVIGVSSGKFTTASKTDPRLQLAILHPMRLCIFQIVTVDGIAEHGDYTKLVPLYDHSLEKPAFSMCHGPFGGVKGREFLCVQHLDSSLRFFEQDGINYERTLATDDRHLPSPVHYLPRVDCFVTVAPSWVLECYRYQDISEALESLRRHDPIWSLCIGEYALDLSVQQISNTESVIVVLGENNLLCVSDTGQVRFIKKLDYSPICFHTFVVGWYWEPDARLIVAVVSESGSLLLYENDRILWCAQLPEIPVAIERANVAGLPGALVTLGPTGSLLIGYLGSEPQLFKVPALNLAPLDLERSQRELLGLEREIRVGVDPSDASIANAEQDVTMEIVIDNPAACVHPTNVPPTDGGGQLEMCQLSVAVCAALNLEMLQVTVGVDPSVQCTTESFLFRDVTPNNTERFETWLYPYEAATPGSLAVTVSCSYTNKNSITRVLQRVAYLPLALFVKSCPASKESLYKITLCAPSSGGAGLRPLFPELCTEASPSPSALGLQSLIDGRRVTIVAAKTTNRLRIQSDELPLLATVLECVLTRLGSGSTVGEAAELAKTPKSRITVSSVPPVSELLNYFRIHHDLRIDLKQLETELEIATGQMRLFERRFVVKLQDRSLRALDGVLMLLKRNHANVAKLCQMLKTMRQAVKLSKIHLGAVLHLFGLCYSYSALARDGGLKYTDHLRALLTSTVADSTEQSFEEMLLPVLRFLEQTGPLRNTSNDGTEEDENYLFDCTDTDRETERTVNDVARAAQHHELVQRWLRRLLERVNGRVATAAKSASGSGRNSVDFEDQPLPEAPNEEEDESADRKDTEDNETTKHLTSSGTNPVSEWVNYENVSDLPL